MDKPYLVSLSDRGGTFTEAHARTFCEALKLREQGLTHYYGCVATIVNVERMDRDGDRIIDGLTDEERDEL